MSRMFAIRPERLVADANEVVVELRQDDVGSLALEMTLLLHGLNESVCLASGAIRLLLTVTEDRTVQATFSRDSGDRLRCSLSRHSAEYLEAALLRAYRDQVAEIDHIHIEGRMNSDSFDLTIVFESFRPPMTPEEAERIMGR